jgi:Putative beta-lactamase-inhibitor-like, PepSY-like
MRIQKILLLLLIILTVTNANAQRCKMKDVPSEVSKSFKAAYPNIKKTYWGKEDSNYQVQFFSGIAPTAITYDSLGNLLLSEIQISVKDLPVEISDYMKKNYQDEVYVDVLKINDIENNFSYEIHVKEMALYFDSKGNFVHSKKYAD